MTTAIQPRSRSGIERPNPSGLVDVIDTILDKGLVIDVYVRVSVVGIELLTVDARIVIASVDTYLKFAEAVNRLSLPDTSDAKGLPDLLGDATEGGAKHKTKGALEAAGDKVKDVFTSDDEDDDDSDSKSRSSRSRRKTKLWRTATSSTSTASSRSPWKNFLMSPVSVIRRVR